MLIDTHAHLTFRDFADDLDGILARAADAGVTRVVTIGTSVESSIRAVALAEKYPNVFAVVGIHPDNAMEAAPGFLDDIRALAQNPRVVAIGETGLDYFRRTPERIAAEKSTQASVFTQQLELAAELGLNVMGRHARPTRAIRRKSARAISLLREIPRARRSRHRPRPPRVVHRHRHFQKRRHRAGDRRATTRGHVHGRDRLSLPRASPIPRQTLRARPHAPHGGFHRESSRATHRATRIGNDGDGGGLLSISTVRQGIRRPRTVCEMD
jgi:TatD related DNase